MAEPNPKKRRRKYLINKEFQTRFVLKFCIPIVLTALISAFALYHFSSKSTTTVFENSRLLIKPTREFIKPGLILSALMSVVIVGIATIAVMLFMSHRIAGPIYKIENSLERMGSGDLSFDIHFRRRDEIKRLAEFFNRATRNLNSLIGGAKAESFKLNSALNELKTLLEKLPKDEQSTTIETIKKLETANSSLGEKLDKFRLR